jgi:hypothetical protein
LPGHPFPPKIFTDNILLVCLLSQPKKGKIVIRKQKRSSRSDELSFDGIGLLSIPLHDYVTTQVPESVRLHFSQTSDKEKKGIVLVEISSTVISEVYSSFFFVSFFGNY